MSRTVKIPSNTKPFWVCEINGKVYSYIAGSTQAVPDEVADLIDNINAMKPKEAAEPGVAGQVWTRLEKGAAWADLPAATEETAGAVKKGVGVNYAEEGADAGETLASVLAQLNALIDSLVDAGIISEYVEPSGDEGSDDD